MSIGPPVISPASLSEAYALLAELLEKARRFEMAVAYYGRLAERWPDVECRHGKTGKQLRDAAMQRSDLKEAVALTAPEKMNIYSTARRCA